MNSQVRKKTSWGFWNWHNYSEEKHPGSFPWHGRAYAYLDGSEDALRVEWNLRSKSCGISLAATPHEETTWTASIKLPPIALYFGASLKKHRLLHRLAEKLVELIPGDMNTKYSGRRFDVSVHDWSLWWHFWVDDSGWFGTRPRWRDGSFHFLDFLLGKQQYASRLVDSREIVVCMPEGQYRGCCELRSDTWTRPRGVTRELRRAHVDMVDPIPVPGKGENAWDCDEDALHGGTFAAKTFAEAVGHLTESALRTRERHGGAGWVPRQKGAAA